MHPRRIYEHSGPAELVLEGENLTPDSLKLYHNGVLYTPLVSSDTYAYYLLGDNGTNKVMLNGGNFFTIEVRDVVIPNGMDGLVSAYQSDVPAVGGGNNINAKSSNNYCINYPYKVEESHPYYRIRIKGTFVSEDLTNLDFVNCSENSSVINSENNIVVNISVTDTAKPAYITYQGFIVAVFNYSA